MYSLFYERAIQKSQLCVLLSPCRHSVHRLGNCHPSVHRPSVRRPSVHSHSVLYPWFWIHAQNFTNVRPRRKNGAKQGKNLYTRYPIVARRAWPLGRVRRASKGILHTRQKPKSNLYPTRGGSLFVRKIPLLARHTRPKRDDRVFCIQVHFVRT